MFAVVHILAHHFHAFQIVIWFPVLQIIVERGSQVGADKTFFVKFTLLGEVIDVTEYSTESETKNIVKLLFLHHHKVLGKAVSDWRIRCCSGLEERVCLIIYL